MEQEQVSRRPFWHDAGTILTAIFFLAIGMTGILMVAGLKIVEEFHETAGVIFVVVALLHTARHWRAVVRYASTRLFWAIIVIICAGTVILTVPELLGEGDEGHGAPDGLMRQTMETLGGAHLEGVAAMLEVTPDSVAEKLRGAGFTVSEPGKTLREIARDSKRDLPEVLAVVTGRRQ